MAWSTVERSLVWICRNLDLRMKRIKALIVMMATCEGYKLGMSYSLEGRTIAGPVTPISNFVLIKVGETIATTKGGIVLPGQVRETRDGGGW